MYVDSCVLSAASAPAHADAHIHAQDRPSHLVISATCLHSQIIKELSPYRNLVISTGGGAVLKPQNWGYMHLGIVAWLNGDTELLARR